MTKLFCPVYRCNKTNFGLTEPHQSHVNKHLYEVHGITVTRTNVGGFRKRQDGAWQRQFEIIEAARLENAKRMNEEFAAFTKDSSLPLPTARENDELDDHYVELMEVWDDEELEETPEPTVGAEAKASSERFGSGSSYDVSFRTLATDEEMDVARILSSWKTPDTPAEHLRQQPRQGVGLPSGRPAEVYPGHADGAGGKGKVADSSKANLDCSTRYA